MAPREATNPFPDQYLSIDYDNVGPIVLPHMQNDGGLNGNGVGVAGGANGNGGGEEENEEVELEDGLLNDLAAAAAAAAATTGGQGIETAGGAQGEGTTGGVESMDEGGVPMNMSQEDESMTLEPQAPQGTMTTNTTPPGHIGGHGIGGNGLPNEVHLPNNIPHGRRTRRAVTRRPGGPGVAGAVPLPTHSNGGVVGNHGTHPGQPLPRYNLRNPNMSFGSDDVDPLAIDMTDATEEEENAWTMANALFLDAAMAASSDTAANHRNCIVNQNGNLTLSVGAGTGTTNAGNSHDSSSGHHGATHDGVSENNNHSGVALPSLAWMNGRNHHNSHSTPPNLQLPLHPVPPAQGTNSQTTTSASASGAPRFVRPPTMFTQDPIINPSPNNPHVAPPPPPNQGSILPSASMNQRRHFFRNRAGSLASVLDQDPSLDSCEDEEDIIQNSHLGGHEVNGQAAHSAMNTITGMTELSTPHEQGMETTLPELDTTLDTTTFLDTTQDTITTNMTDNGNIELMHGDESFTTAPSSPPPSPLRPSPAPQNNIGNTTNAPMSISYADRAVSSGSHTNSHTTSPSGNSGRGIVTSLTNASANTTRAMGNLTSHINGTGNDPLTLSPVRRSYSGTANGTHGVGASNQQYAAAPTHIVTDEDTASNSSNSNGCVSPLQTDVTPGTPTTPNTTFGTPHGTPSPGGHLLQAHHPSPHRRTNSSITSSSGRSIRWNPAFEASVGSTTIGSVSESSLATDGTYLHSGATSSRSSSNTTSSGNHINLTFGTNTTVSDLKYFAERGCIVPLLRALTTPRLKTLGTRMLADYAKMPQRRVAVASNKRILEFCCRTMLEMPWEDEMGTEWPAREYAVETVRSLTATEDSDSYLMGCTGLLKTLAVVARGGPFARSQMVNPRAAANGNGGSASVNGNLHPLSTVLAASTTQYNFITTIKSGLVSGKARLHACIAIMNLSCGKANKIDIASHPEVLEAMRDVMMADPDEFAPATSSPPLPNSSSSNATPESVAEEARLKAATCIKNLSNADANDTALISSPGLLEALGYVASKTCTSAKGPSNCTTNSCLALMNLSIAKGNKHKVFQTKGVMDALMTVITCTAPTSPGETIQRNANNEARIKACSALSNLAIGYENKIPMFNYPGFVKAILKVIDTDSGEARTKACSILWSFAAEIRNQVPVVKRGDILPMLVRVAEEDNSTEARFKCVAALTLLAESLDNALPLLHCGALHPLMDILHDAGADPTQWKGQTASWCVGFLMNIAQSDDAVPFLREAGVVELLAPLLTLDHYQSLKAAMAVTFVCRYDEDDETYDLLRKTENVIPKIISLLHNTLSGRGGNGYKYGVFTLRSSVGCISSLASGPEFMKERIATGPVFESLLKVLSDFCVNGGQKGAIVGGGRDDTLSATLAIRALQSLTEYLIPIPGSSTLPFGDEMDNKLLIALKSFETFDVSGVTDKSRNLAKDAHNRIHRGQDLVASGQTNSDSGSVGEPSTPVRSVPNNIIENSIVASLVQGCCIGPSVHSGDGDEGFFPPTTTRPSPTRNAENSDGDDSSASVSSRSTDGAVRTFLLTDSRTGRRFAVPIDPSGGRAFNDGRIWCYRRGRFCRPGESPDPNFHWTDELQAIYSAAITSNRSSSMSSSSQGSSESRGATAVTPDRTNGSPSSHVSSNSGNRGVPAVRPLRQNQK